MSVFGFQSVQLFVSRLRFADVDFQIPVSNFLKVVNEFLPDTVYDVVAKIITDLAFNFKVQLTQIKESTERMKTVKAKKMQRKSAPSLSCVSNNEKDERTDLEQFLNTAMNENGRKTREPSPMMWSSR